ncbi:MAG: polyprenyl synthetase family protein [Candidatus Margulisbacteria bacterium]|nr:polyprenyl synthetase family protein [Candidatus Margulisiibacteriota bacterium]
MSEKGSLSDVNRALDRYLPRKSKLARAMRYSVFAGGKRFRPILCLAVAQALGKPAKKVLPFACAVEMIHTFTLIHDDLPAMDDSQLRRGKPTCHKVYGEALAILAGDALNTLAFAIIADRPAAVLELAQAALTVVEGQVADVTAPQRRLTLQKLRAIHRWKTAALLSACVRGAAQLCGATGRQLKALTAYAEHLGMAFQIADDILDVTATAAQLGKPVRSDVKKGFPYVVGLNRSRQMAAAEKERALAALRPFGPKAARLAELARFVTERTK